jgi:Holliday junction resolvasome RuvABC endonuclease subunit
VILGLDCGAAYGWAVVDDLGAYVRSGHRELPSGLDLGPSCHRFSMSIADLIDEFGITLVYAEKPVSQHYGAQRRLFAYPAIAALIAHLHHADYREINRSEAYLAVVGKGNAPKLSGVLFGRQFKPLLNSDDEGDAILVALAAHKLRERRQAA